MAGRVIQGFFIGGALRSPGAALVAPPRQAAGLAGPPALAFGGRIGTLQASATPGRPPFVPAPASAPAIVAQRSGGNGDMAIDPVRLGLARGGGQCLPAALRTKMEAAFQADFSAVRVHVGPQAARIGAIAFTTGNDLYFAPGQFQPEGIKGQQLIGHELAHVIQQRQGRVRAPASGVAVVQDSVLEAEADRLGMRAAAYAVPVQARLAPGGAVQRSAIAVSAPEPIGAGRFRLTARADGRAVGSVTVDVKGRPAAFVSDLGVDANHRDRGVGKMLLAHAARTGLRFGKAAMELAADDKGSGRLTRWYKDMGFARTGTNERQQPVFKASSSRISAVQAKPAFGVVQRSFLVPLNAASKYTMKTVNSEAKLELMGQGWLKEEFAVSGAATGFVIQRITRTLDARMADNPTVPLAIATIENFKACQGNVNMTGWDDYYELFEITAGAATHADCFTAAMINPDGATDYSCGRYEMMGDAYFTTVDPRAISGNSWKKSAKGTLPNGLYAIQNAKSATNADLPPAESASLKRFMRIVWWKNAAGMTTSSGFTKKTGHFAQVAPFHP